MKFGLHYGFQSNSEDWPNAYAENLQQIARAEELGFSSVTVSEHHFVSDGWCPAPFAVLGAIAARTSRIRLGTGVVLMPLHKPVEVAEYTSVLDVLSRGRFFLGVGLGYRKEEFDAFGAKLEKRGAVFEESIEVLKRLLTKRSVSHRSENYVLNGITITPRPVQKPMPPIWIAAKSEKAVRRAARMGDAWFIDPVTPLKIIKERMRDYVDELKKVGRDLGEVEMPLRREAFVWEGGDAWEQCKKGILYNYGEDYFKWGHVMDDDGNVLDPEKTDFKRYIQTIRKRFIIGSPDHMIGEVERYQKELGVNHIVFKLQFPGLPHRKVLRSIEFIGKKVIPYFREKAKK